MNKPYTMEDIDTADINVVSAEVTRIYEELFEDAVSGFVREIVGEVQEMFEGNFSNYQAMDTVYHDLEHTLQASLCWARLMARYIAHSEGTVLGRRHFEIGLVAALMHDVGYLKEATDAEGTGAKFTYEHERRSCAMAQEHLFEKGWPQREIFAVQHIISCTGPRAFIDTVPFRDAQEHVLGMMLCTADFLGQMSDPRYIEKLPILFKEFEESDNFHRVPKQERLFRSVEELIARTPRFWDQNVLPKLDGECQGLYQHLEEPYPGGTNPYLAKIEEHLEHIRTNYPAARKSEKAREAV